MKKLHIVLLIAIAVTIGAIVLMAGDYTTYASFIDAKKGNAVNVVGYLVKDKAMEYDAKKDPNYFAFVMADKQGNEQKVVYVGSKPQDFERSEQLVVKGRMDGNVFRASEISMKCPSKYVNDQITLKESSDGNGNVTVKQKI